MPISDWTPSVADVGNVLRARTKTSNGVEIGTFNSDTRPTDTQVLGLIADGVSDISIVTGDDLPTQVWQNAKSTAALATALKVELGYFPEQIGTGRSPYAAIKVLFDDGLKRLLTAIELINSGGGTVDGGPPKPVSSFPMVGDPFIFGRGTRW